MINSANFENTVKLALPDLCPATSDNMVPCLRTDFGQGGGAGKGNTELRYLGRVRNGLWIGMLGEFEAFQKSSELQADLLFGV